MRAFRVAYDGRPFHGFQRQPDVPTVENALFDALRDLDALDDTKPGGYAAAGRTDAGVSARAQTIAFEAPDWLTPRAFNSELPDSIRVWASADVPGGFHATHHARYREYVYHLHAPAIDDDRVERACDALSGEHDFHNLTPDDDDTVRDLTVDAVRDDEFLVLTVRAGGFPRALVRRAVSLVRSVGSGDADLAFVDRVLDDAPLDGPQGVPSAPAYPLVLAAVGYDESFEVDEKAAADCRETFDAVAAERRTLARVAADVAGE